MSRTVEVLVSLAAVAGIAVAYTTGSLDFIPFVAQLRGTAPGQNSITASGAPVISPPIALVDHSPLHPGSGVLANRFSNPPVYASDPMIIPPPAPGFTAGHHGLA